MTAADWPQITGSALVGFVAALATFRARFVSVEKDISAGRATSTADRERDRAQLAMELHQVREQIATGNRRIALILKLVMDLTNKAGVNNRLSDLIPQLIEEKTTE